METKRLILLTLMIIAFVSGDVMYEMVTTTEGVMGMGKSQSLIRTFIKGKRMRTEVTTQHPAMGEIKDISILRLDKNLIWILDADEKVYTEMPINEELPKEIDTTGIIPQIEVKKFEEKKKILDYECEKYVVSMETKSGDENINLSLIFWVCKDFPGYEEISAFNKNLMRDANKSSNMGMMGIGLKSLETLQKKISEIEGFPLETEIEFNMPSEEIVFSFKTKSEVTKITTVPISDRVFELPQGYKLKEE